MPNFEVVRDRRDIEGGGTSPWMIFSPAVQAALVLFHTHVTVAIHLSTNLPTIFKHILEAAGRPFEPEVYVNTSL